MKKPTVTALMGCVFGFSLFMLSGCGGGVERPQTAPVEGAVMYNGEPIVGATVSFWTDGASRAATGVTNAEGKFQLSMFDVNDGAIPGDHTITVSKVEAGETGGPSAEDMLNDPLAMAQAAGEQGGTKAKGPKSLVPAKYGDRNSSPLKETVKADGENKFVLQLAD